MSSRVAVIGAGIAGLSMSTALAERGIDTTLFEADRVGSGVSGNSYAWINSHKKHPDRYHELNVRGLEYWHRRFTGLDPQVFFPSGHLVVASSPATRAQLLTRAEHARARGYPVRDLSLREARTIEPGALLDFDEDETACFHFPSEGYVCAPRVLDHLLATFLSANGSFVNTKVTALALDGAGVVVQCADGLVPFDAVFVCAGLRSTELLATAGFELPLVPPEPAGASLGFLAYVDAPEGTVSGILTTDLLGAHSTGDGELVLQAVDLDAATVPGRTRLPEAVLAEFRSRLGSLFPALAAREWRARQVERVMPLDGLPLAGPLDQEQRLWALTTHSGFTLAPLLGQDLADDYLTGAAVERAWLSPTRATDPDTRPRRPSLPGEQ